MRRTRPRRLLQSIPSASITSRSKDADSFFAVSDSCHELVIEPTFDVVTIFIAMEPNIYDTSAPLLQLQPHRSRIRTWHQDVSIMSYEVLNDPAGAILDIHVPPIHPTVLRLHRCRQQVIPGLAHSFPPRPLFLEFMPFLHSLTQSHAEVFLNDHHAVERYLVRPGLYSVQLH